nr:hypothetical protein [Trentepohlia sp. YN1317]
MESRMMRKYHVRFGNELLYQCVTTKFHLIQTKRGHFIVNGYPKTVIHQIIRSPGIRFKNEENQILADIISVRGAWMGIRIQYEKTISFRTFEMNNILKNFFASFFSSEIKDFFFFPFTYPTSSSPKKGKKKKKTRNYSWIWQCLVLKSLENSIFFAGFPHRHNFVR